MDTAERLRHAVVSNKLSTAKLIIERHPRLLVNQNPSNGWTNLHYAAYHGHYQMCVFLVSCGHDSEEISLSHLGETPLHLAAGQNHEQALHYIAQHFARTIDWCNSELCTALMVATAKGNDPCVNLLLDFGADIDIGDASGSRPIHIAAARGHVKTLRTLVDRGADATTPNADGWAPQDFAATFQVKAYLKTLIADLRKPPPVTVGGRGFGPSTPIRSTFSFPDF